MTERVQRTARVYDKIAPHYAEQEAGESPSDEIEKFTTLLLPHGHILDAGCGIGRDLNTFFNRGFSGFGIDVSKRLLTIAMKLHPHLPFELADIRNMPQFPDAGFDGIWAHESFHHLERQDMPTTLLEWQRILKPEGVVYISAKRGQGEVTVREEKSGGQPREYTLLEPEELRTMFTQTGFEQIELYTFNEQERKEHGRDLEWLCAFYRKAY
ncbi:MAG: class I SAM-dependent methyltransferase [Rubrobacter sp.]|nr:class I SAM-dependent methyltransferase [Rubrobacter sp.]